MNKSIYNLENSFEKIKKMGWIPVPKRGYGENGMIFENLLGIKCNDLPVADYDGVELKVQSKFSKFPITLFSLNLDGPSLFEIQRIVNRYGAFDYMFPASKVMYIVLNAKDFSSWGRSLKMKLCCDIKKRKLYILVSHANGKIIEKIAFWNFSSIKETVERKVSLLCIANCTTKYIDDSKFIKFEEIHFYELLSFEQFINALCDGTISIQIKYGVYKTGEKAGQPYNHGLAFQISPNDLSKIFCSYFLQKK